MALIKFSALVSDMRNKLNGSVLAKNKGGNYMRNKTTPVNPQTEAQMIKRAQFGALSAAYRSLSAADIDKWNAAAANFPYTDIFGDSRTLSGSQLYVKLNNNLAQVNTPALTTPPNPAGTGTPSVTSVLVEVTDETITPTMALIGAPASARIVYEATRALSDGVRFYKNEYRQIAVSSSLTPVLPADLWNAYINKFGAPVVGENISFRIHLVNSATGEASVGVTAKASVVA